MNNFIYLASSSQSRQALLRSAKIPFVPIKQLADETGFDKNCGRSLQALVTEIAIAKIEQTILPENGYENEVIYVLAADTMGRNAAGEILGKPKNQADAVRMLKSYRAGAETGTTFCLEKRVWQDRSWLLLERVVRYVKASYTFNVPDEMLDLYFKHAMNEFGLSYLDVSGAVAIEGYGMQFVANFTGSFTTVMGLPLYELREELTRLQFPFS